MAKKKQEEPPKGSPAWMSTFSDLMNLLLCFFVLLFSMSTVDAEQFELVAASLSNSFSILPAGGSAIGDGTLVANGISQLNNLAEYVQNMGVSMDEAEDKELEEEIEEIKLEQSEAMAEQIEEYVEEQNMQEYIEIDFNSQYVLLTLNGSVLFDSGSSDLREDAVPLIDSIGNMLLEYTDNIIEIEGHTDNVPIHNAKYESNNVLSSYRALSVAEYFINNKNIDPTKLKYSGRGEYIPVADNATSDGRALNRRVEIKIYNELSSN